MMKNIFVLAGLVWCTAGMTFAQEPDRQVETSLKELHGAFEAYRKDHGGEYPPLSQTNEAGERVLWVEMLKPYLRDDSAAARVEVDGPFFTPYTALENRRQGNVTSVSFGYNRFAFGRDAGGKEEEIRFAVREVPEPDATILLVELDAVKQPGAGWYSAWCDPAFDFARYQGKAHVLFASGRVALLFPEELLVDDKPATALAPWFGDLSKNP